MSDAHSTTTPPPAAPPRRRRRWMRWLVGILAFLFIGIPVLLAAVVVGALFWVNSDSGSATVARMAGDYVPGLHIEGLSGPLPGHIGVRKLTMADDQGPWLEVENATLDLTLSALWQRRLQVNVVEAGRVALLRLPPSAPTPEPAADANQPITIPALPALPVSISLDRLAIGRIELGQPVMGTVVAFRLDGEAKLDTRPNTGEARRASGLQAGLRSARLDGPGSAQVALDLSPAADRLVAHVTLDEPAGGVLGGLMGQPGAPVNLALDLDGPATGAKLVIKGQVGDGTDTDPARVDLGGTVGLQPGGDITLAMDGTVAPGPFMPPNLRASLGPAVGQPGLGLTVRYAPDGTVDIDRLAVTLPLGKVEANGRLDAGGNAALAVKLALGQSAPLASLLPPGLGWQAIDLDGTIKGPLASPAIVAQARPRGLTLPEAYSAPALALLGEAPVIDFAGALPGTIENFRLSGRGITLAAKGEVMPTLDATVNLDLPDLAPLAGALSTSVAGALHAEAKLTGKLEGPDVDLRVTSPGLTAAGRKLGETTLATVLTGLPATPRGTITLRSSLDDLPLTVDAAGGWDGVAGTLDQLAAKLGAAQIAGKGRYGPEMKLPQGEFRVAVPDLAAFAKLAGQPMAGRLTLNATSDAQKVALNLDAPSITVAGQTFSADAKAEGTPENVGLTLNGQTKLPDGRQAKLSTRARLLSEAERRVVELAALDLTAEPFGLRLTAPGRVLLGNDGTVETPGLVFATRPGGSLRINGRYGPGAIAAKVNLTGLNLAALRSALPLAEGTPNIAGTVELDATVSGSAEAPVVVAKLNGRNLATDLPAAKGLPSGTVTVDARYDMKTLLATAQARMGTAMQLDARVSMPRGTTPTSPIEARLTAQADVATVTRPALQGSADQMAGKVNLDVRASGTANAPVLSGEARLSNASWRNPLYGIRYTGVEGRVTAQGNTLTIENFRANTPGNGRIEAAGTIDAAGEGMPGDLRITARNAQPIAGDLGRVTLDADVTVKGPLTGGATVGGVVHIDRADLRLPENISNAVPTLDPVRRVGTPLPKPPTTAVPAPPYVLALRIEAPQSIFIRWRGLDAEMGGTINVGGTAREPDVTGKLGMRRGLLDLLDRRLTFTRGNINFTGPVIPELDFLISSVVQSTTVSITITGQATDPKLAFSASPELPQDEVLALLIFQRQTKDLSAIELAQLAAGVASLTGALPGSSDGGPLSRIGRSLGLDRLGLGSSSNSSSSSSSTNSNNDNSLPSLEAGTYVGKGVYVGVQQGADSASTRVAVEVELTPRLKLETSTGGDSGERVGVKWEYEY